MCVYIYIYTYVINIYEIYMNMCADEIIYTYICTYMYTHTKTQTHTHTHTHTNYRRSQREGHKNSIEFSLSH